MSNLVDHAKRELAILGYTGNEPEDDPNRWMYDNVIQVVEAFAGGGHSGHSAFYALGVIQKVLNFQNVAPLTDNPDEWMNVCQYAINGEDLWQNCRNSECFSHDGGKTYYKLSEMRTGWRAKLFGQRKFHKSQGVMA